MIFSMGFLIFCVVAYFGLGILLALAGFGKKN
jgi:hypothetical protein